MEEEIGSRKPSQFLRDLQSLASNTPVHENLIRQLWLNRLPSQVQAILQAQSPEQTLEQLAHVADNIFEITPSVPYNAVKSMETPNTKLLDLSTSTSSSPICTVSHQPSKFESEIATVLKELSEKINQIEMKLRSNHRSTSKSRNRLDFRSRERDGSSSTSGSQEICYYHRRFGKYAKKCTNPCHFSLNSNGSQ